MTYNLFRGKLNPTESIDHFVFIFHFPSAVVTVVSSQLAWFDWSFIGGMTNYCPSVLDTVGWVI